MLFTNACKNANIWKCENVRMCVRLISHKMNVENINIFFLENLSIETRKILHNCHKT